MVFHKVQNLKISGRNLETRILVIGVLSTYRQQYVADKMIKNRIPIPLCFARQHMILRLTFFACKSFVRERHEFNVKFAHINIFQNISNIYHFQNIYILFCLVRASHRDKMVTMLNYSLEINKFELQSRDYVRFQTNALL